MRSSSAHTALAYARLFSMPGTTALSIEGERFPINGRPTYAGRVVDGHRVEGLLFDARLPPGIPGAATGGPSAQDDCVEGYRLVPVNWRIHTHRKHAYFERVRRITGA
jgi:hypothetical protein